ncbi:MAG: MOSC domain-containing protein [Longimicrobiales bacterium]
MKLSRLFVYPVKSLAGIEVQNAQVDDFGVVKDRRWMLVDPAGIALTQRDQPRMALIRPTLIDNVLRLDAPGMPSLFVDDFGLAQRTVTVWNDTVTAEDADDAAAEWLSSFLETDVRLVYMPDTTFRRIDPDYSNAERRVSFADGYPFLLVSQESMDELNRRLEHPMGIERFRPNLVVSGASEPHAEDNWGRIRIGSIEFDVVKACARCAVPSIDPVTAQKGKEPNRTLATYRKRNGEVYFGQNVIHAAPGTLRVGSAVTLL